MCPKLIALCVCFVCVVEVSFAVAKTNTFNNNTELYDKLVSAIILEDTQFDGNGHQLNKNNVAIHTDSVASYNNTLKINRKRKNKRKKKRRIKSKKDVSTQDAITEISLTETTTPFLNQTPSHETKKKRRRKKRRRKKNQQQNNILEVTTARPLNKTTIQLHIKNNQKFADLVDQLNKNVHTNSTPEPTVLSPKNDDVRNTSYVKSHEKIKIFVNSTGRGKNRNRCSVNNGGCSQICKPRGKMKCFCLEGFTLAKNRKKCIDVNECRIKNGGCKEICRNTLGAYYCDCPLGFRISDDSKSCQDINECHLRNGHGPCQGTCTNTYGSYSCDCSHLNGTRLGKDKHSCEDINECEEAHPGCSHLCINTRMGGYCACPEGLELMSDYKTCQDVDECEDTAIKSLCLRGCVNTVGSYYCEEDFQNDQNLKTMKVPACPPLDLPQYGFITCQRNKSLPYDTFTKNGRRIIKNSPGTKCQLECPVGFKLLGEGRFVCGISGKWKIKKRGLCIKSPYPKLQCPTDQEFALKKGEQKALVHFPSPQTNIRWKFVKSYPKWAKTLKGELPEGRHGIQFSVTDPASRLSSTCSFIIIIKK